MRVGNDSESEQLRGIRRREYRTDSGLWVQEVVDELHTVVRRVRRPGRDTEQQDVTVRPRIIRVRSR